MFLTMSLTSYESFFKYESNDIKLVWYNIQILELSVKSKINKFESWVLGTPHQKKRR